MRGFCLKNDKNEHGSLRLAQSSSRWSAPNSGLQMRSPAEYISSAVAIDSAQFEEIFNLTQFEAKARSVVRCIPYTLNEPRSFQRRNASK